MRIIQGTTDFRLPRTGLGTAVAIGKFDGVHLGHQKIISALLEQKKNGLIPVIFTFEPDPAAFFSGRNLPKLTSKQEKRALFERLGIEILIEFPLTEESAAIPPERFITEYLVERMGARFVAAGSDLSFGARGAGNVRLIQEEGAPLGLCVQILQKMRFEPLGIEISSSAVRSEIFQGNVQVAAALLGRNYSLLVEECRGSDVSSIYNVKFSLEKIIPAAGVYDALLLDAESGESLSSCSVRILPGESFAHSAEIHIEEKTPSFHNMKKNVQLAFLKKTEVEND